MIMEILQRKMETVSHANVIAWTGMVSGVACGFVCGWLLRGKFRPSFAYGRNSSSSTTETIKTTETLTDLLSRKVGSYKLILVVRKDLNMGRGKAAAQCCHATADAIKKLILKNPEMLMAWEECGQPKVVVKADDEQQLVTLDKEARTLGLVTSVIRDAGLTQVASGSVTVLGVGPGPEHLVNKVTGCLKLY